MALSVVICPYYYNTRHKYRDICMQYLPTSFAQRLLQGRKFYSRVICEVGSFTIEYLTLNIVIMVMFQMLIGVFNCQQERYISRDISRVYVEYISISRGIYIDICFSSDRFLHFTLLDGITIVSLHYRNRYLFIRKLSFLYSM